MDKLVKLIFAFWIVVIIGIIITAIASNPWLLMLAILFLIIGIATAIVNFDDKRMAKKKTKEDNQGLTNESQNDILIIHKDDELSKNIPLDTYIPQSQSLEKGIIDEKMAVKSSVYQSVKNTNQSSGESLLEPFDLLTGVQFKDLIEKHFKKNGYSVNRISPRINSIDFLIDKNGITAAVATRLTFDLISRSYIAKVIESVKMYEGVTTTMIITNSFGCVLQAQQLANDYGIIVWDREVLKSQLGGLK